MGEYNLISYENGRGDGVGPFHICASIPEHYQSHEVLAEKSLGRFPNASAQWRSRISQVLESQAFPVAQLVFM